MPDKLIVTDHQPNTTLVRLEEENFVSWFYMEIERALRAVFIVREANQDAAMNFRSRNRNCGKVPLAVSLEYNDPENPEDNFQVVPAGSPYYARCHHFHKFIQYPGFLIYGKSTLAKELADWL